ncbi:MAG TPA: hypothetical protein VKM93_07915 [Terriglobia bacterium]|nr:hypothetical protein [Terriglobia bacterium]
MLRKSPTRTEAFLAANRRNAQKCTGPRTPEGKARGSLNGLKNGRYAEQLPEKLEAAGYHSAAALYSQIRSETTVAFNVERDSVGAKQVERVTAQVWCLAWRTGVLGPKPESPLFRKDSRRLSRARLLFRIRDPRLRIGMVYWVQRKRYWTAKRWIQDVLNGVPSPVPTVAQALESKLRKRVYRLGRPDFVEQVRYGLDRNGFPDPHAPPNPALLRLHEKLYSGRWWEGKEKNDEL